MSRPSYNSVISRVKKAYTPAVPNTILVGVVGPGQHMHDVEAERRPGICPGIVLPVVIRTQQFVPVFGMAKRGRSRIVVR